MSIQDAYPKIKFPEEDIKLISEDEFNKKANTYGALIMAVPLVLGLRIPESNTLFVYIWKDDLPDGLRTKITP